MIRGKTLQVPITLQKCSAAAHSTVAKAVPAPQSAAELHRSSGTGAVVYIRHKPYS